MRKRTSLLILLIIAAVWTLTVSEADAHPLADAKPEAEAIAEANRCGSCNSGNNYGTSSSGYSTGGYNDDCPFSCGGAGVFTKILEGLQIIINHVIYILCINQGGLLSAIIKLIFGPIPCLDNLGKQQSCCCCGGNNK
ncbi:uncharacterized protein LOC124366099 [Homalodisca vitripennis]|uniref:uncharacterized protein LOC124366099 n=1 Tax=Homalodisca vitripennis TaxID=197043 RepID=UPI001EEB2D1C|nr:uncharacterized protein LOC124366099 [Homalodisca vitripennis]